MKEPAPPVSSLLPTPPVAPAPPPPPPCLSGPLDGAALLEIEPSLPCGGETGGTFPLPLFPGALKLPPPPDPPSSAPGAPGPDHPPPPPAEVSPKALETLPGFPASAGGKGIAAPPAPTTIG